MSIESVAIALHHSRAAGTAKLVLIGIANHDGDGGAWPSVATLAKYAGVTPRNVQQAVKRLVELREVVRLTQAGGTTETPNHMRPNRYHFTLQCPPDCDRTSRHRTRRDVLVTELPDPLSPATPGDDSDTPGGVGTDTRTVPEPSITTSLLPNVGTDRARDTSCSGSASGHHHFNEQTGWCDNACGARSAAPIGAHA